MTSFTEYLHNYRLVHQRQKVEIGEIFKEEQFASVCNLETILAL